MNEENNYPPRMPTQDEIDAEADSGFMLKSYTFRRYKCIEEFVYFENNLNAPLPVLPVGLGRNIGKRQPPLRFGKPKREFSKEWVQSPVDSVRQRNRGANNP